MERRVPRSARSVRSARSSSVSAAPFPERVDAPFARAVGGEVKEHEAVERREFAAVHDGPEAPRSVGLKVGYSHFARRDERDRTGEHTQGDRGAPEDFDHPREPHLRERLSWRGPPEPAEEFWQAVLEEEKAGDDTQERIDSRRQGSKDLFHAERLRRGQAHRLPETADWCSASARADRASGSFGSRRCSSLRSSATVVDQWAARWKAGPWPGRAVELLSTFVSVRSGVIPSGDPKRPGAGEAGQDSPRSASSAGRSVSGAVGSCLYLHESKKATRFLGADRH